MGRKSSITRLEPEIRDFIGKLRDQGRTLDEIMKELRKLDLDEYPSRSALGRHTKQLDAIAAKM